ncbi:MAG: MmgE/PrpD family protein [Azospirillaceae bacterium]
MSLSRDLAERATALGFRDLPPAAVTAAKVSLADALAVSLAAVALEPAAGMLADHAAATGGPPEATVIGRADRLPAAQAALANGALAHALDFEDTHDAALVHPNAAVVPAVLALAEREGADGETVLTALALGADLACRLGLALGDRARGRGWYQPPMLGAMGAALASAKVLGLDAGRTVDALSLTACLFALPDGFMANPSSQLRAVRDGFAARAAVEAVDLAKAGMRGAAAPLDGASGLLDMLGGPGTADRLVLDDYGARFRATEVVIKRWPSCRGTHGAIAAGLSLHAEGLPPSAIAGIDARVAPPDDMLFRPIAQKQRPETAIDAKFSIPFTLASAMVNGRIDLDSFQADRLADRHVRTLAERITLADVIEPGDPRAGFAVRLVDGNTRFVPLPRASGLTAGAASLTDLADKVHDCFAHGGVDDMTGQFLEAIALLEIAGLVPLCSMLAQAGPRGGGAASGAQVLTRSLP